MLDEGVCTAVRSARVVGYVERESYLAALLLARMEEKSLAPAPLWCGNLEEFDGREWRGAVDCLTAGFPCQPFSVAGKKEGTADKRYLWPFIREIICATEVPVVFLENVPGLAIQLGLNRVLGDLAEMGFDAEWCHIAACDVGASHQRERIFLLAVREIGRFRELWESSGVGRFLDGSSGTVDNAPSARHDGARQWAATVERSGECVPSARCETVAHAIGQRFEGNSEVGSDQCRSAALDTGPGGQFSRSKGRQFASRQRSRPLNLSRNS